MIALFVEKTGRGGTSPVLLDLRCKLQFVRIDRLILVVETKM